MPVWIVREISCDEFIVNMKPNARKLHEWGDIAGPTDLIWPQVVENVPHTHEVGSEDQFFLFRTPDRDGPVTDNAAEALAVPAIEGSRNDRNVGGLASRSLHKFGDKLFLLSSRPSQVRMKPRRET